MKKKFILAFICEVVALSACMILPGIQITEANALVINIAYLLFSGLVFVMAKILLILGFFDLFKKYIKNLYLRMALSYIVGIVLYIVINRVVTAIMGSDYYYLLENIRHNLINVVTRQNLVVFLINIKDTIMAIIDNSDYLLYQYRYYGDVMSLYAFFLNARTLLVQVFELVARIYIFFKMLESEDEIEEETKELLYCPYCGTMIDKNYNFCKGCGNKL